MALEQLFESLSQRKRPEDVAEMILGLLGDMLSAKEKGKLERAARGSLKRSFWGYTSMSQQFKKPVGAEKQIAKAVEIFKLAPVSKETYNDPASIAGFIATTSHLIGKEYQQSHFVKHRLNKAQRLAQGLDLSKRQYNKRFRLMKRLEQKLGQFTQEQKKAEFGQLAKHGLAHHITWNEFSQDENTACFIAYFTARCNLRSQFTIAGQEGAYDEIADMLFDRCLGETRKGFWGSLTGTPAQKDHPINTTYWWAIAQVYPHASVLTHLTEEQKGLLLGRWTAILQEIAAMLQDVYQNSRINRQTMVVQKGNDSSTWNATAGAWNKARDSWMNLVYSLGLESILEQMCFGKVLRLMAADVVAWHRLSGGGLDPNTTVWNLLPLPWQVFSGKEVCTKAMVEKACRNAGIDPNKSGWVAPRPHGVVAFKPTPELVHGVSIANPFLANVLKQHHCFSGKPTAKVFNPQDN